MATHGIWAFSGATIHSWSFTLLRGVHNPLKLPTAALVAPQMHPTKCASTKILPAAGAEKSASSRSQAAALVTAEDARA